MWARPQKAEETGKKNKSGFVFPVYYIVILFKQFPDFGALSMAAADRV